MSRERVVMMARIRDEARWIGMNLERTFQVAQTVVIWDDGSVDLTSVKCWDAVGPQHRRQVRPWGWVVSGEGPAGPQVLHYLESPFTEVVRPKQRVNELRDKNALWEYVKAAVDFDYVLCLDGDEMLSHRLVRDFPRLLRTMDERGIDFMALPFIYLWDRPDQQRVDGIYGVLGDGLKKLRFPRVFSIKRLNEQELFDTSFLWYGTRGGFHCGSIPQHQFQPGGALPMTAAWAAPVVHWGYMAAADRQRKFEFYSAIDPDNEFEGRYLHIIQKANQHAPGPVQFAEWKDE